MTNKPVLVDLPKLRELVAELDLNDAKAKDYIDARWLNYVAWWDSRARQAKIRYLAMRGAVVIGGAAIPALVGLRELQEFGDVGWLFAIASIVVSFVIAVCAGLESLFGYGDVWREKRAAAELIKIEGFSFFHLCGAYEKFRSHADAYKLFATNVENLIRSEIKDYILAVSPKPDDPTNKG